MEKLEPLCIAIADVKPCSCYGKWCGSSSCNQKCNYHVIPTISLPRYIPERTPSVNLNRYFYTYVNSSIIYNSQKAEAISMSRDGWMGKQNAVYTYNGILFSLKKDGNSDTCYNMDEPWRHYASEISQSQKDN